MVMFFGGKPEPVAAPEAEMDIMMVYATTAIAVAIILAMMLMSTKSKLASAEKSVMSAHLIREESECAAARASARR